MLNLFQHLLAIGQILKQAQDDHYFELSAIPRQLMRCAKPFDRHSVSPPNIKNDVAPIVQKAVVAHFIR
jgi:hypothetical protein